ncbi:hypothetical protein KM043_006912 [Ampulex compressa]|nr:hypothetical protein KM043_006912 [Ampulex compressa]
MRNEVASTMLPAIEDKEVLTGLSTPRVPRDTRSDGDSPAIAPARRKSPSAGFVRFRQLARTSYKARPHVAPVHSRRAPPPTHTRGPRMASPRPPRLKAPRV